MIKNRPVFLAIVLALMLSACGGEATPIPPTPRPTAFPTPLSNPLPTPQPRVTEVAQFQVLIANPSTRDTGAISTLLNKTGRNFVVEVGEYSDALKALCGPAATFAWVDGWTLLTALSQKCASPLMEIRSTVAGATTSGVKIQLLASADTAKVRTVADFKDQVFCRLGGTDRNTWIIPVLLMRAAGNIDPFNDLRNVRNVPDMTTLLSEVAYGRCVGAGVSGDWNQTVVPGFGDINARINVIASSPLIPFGGLLTNTTGDVTDDVIATFSQNPDQLRAMLDFDELNKLDGPDAYNDALNFFRNAGLGAQR